MCGNCLRVSYISSVSTTLDWIICPAPKSMRNVSASKAPRPCSSNLLNSFPKSSTKMLLLKTYLVTTLFWLWLPLKSTKATSKLLWIWFLEYHWTRFWFTLSHLLLFSTYTSSLVTPISCWKNTIRLPVLLKCSYFSIKETKNISLMWNGCWCDSSKGYQSFSASVIYFWKNNLKVLWLKSSKTLLSNSRTAKKRREFFKNTTNSNKTITALFPSYSTTVVFLLSETTEQ